ncbi:MAG TPA: flavin reductase family protein [Bryobacteraceae bacterium]|nr:flavin reductase family protein [Bryobacteraceae bacterium]
MQCNFVPRKLHDRIRVIRLSSDLFRRVCAGFATGVCVVTTLGREGEPHGLTINSFASLSLNPPLVMVAVDFASPVLAVFESSGAYAVNILREDQRDLSIRFAELPEGRFEGVAWNSGSTGSPVIDPILGVIECRIVQAVEAGDHRILIGEVVELSCSEGRPLVFFGSGYARLA